MKENPSTSTSNIDEFIRPNKFLCEIIGMMPIRLSTISVLQQWTVYCRILLLIFAGSTFVVPQFLLIIFNWGDIAILTSVGCIMTTVLQLLFKICYLLWRRDKATRMYELVDQLWKLSEDREDFRAIEKYASQAKLFTVIFAACCFANVSAFLLVAAINLFEVRRNRDNQTDFTNDLPFDVWYGDDPLSWTHLKLAFAGQSFAAILGSVGIIGLDTSMMTLILHMCSQFRLIQCWFRKIAQRIKNELTKNDHNFTMLINNKIRRDIGKCIEHHTRMLLIIEDVDDLLNPIILVQFVTSGIEICLSGFTVMNSTTNFGDLLKSTCYLLATLFQLVVWCWPGEILNYESKAIGETIYMDVLWYEFPKELRMDICVVIARSQKECQITAMQFQSMSIRTLGRIFNTAASYFALLRQLYQ